MKNMKIAVLDSYTLNPGDLSWDALKELGDDCRIYDRTPADKILERSKDVEIILTNKTPLSTDTISKLPALKYIGLLSTGYDVVNVRKQKNAILLSQTYRLTALSQLLKWFLPIY